MTVAAPTDGTDAFLTVRPRLFAAAYRMLGSVADAEDILQEAWLRWQSATRSEVRDATGYLLRITTRLCLDQMKSARARRETYPGPWLPEPLVTEDATERLDRDVSLALMLALERLTPLERAAFLLHDLFDCSHDEVAAALGRSAASCRQLTSRARRHVHQQRPRALLDAGRGADIARAFFAASRTGDTATLTRLLAEDVVLLSDGGGKASAALNPIYGRDRTLRLIAGLLRKYGVGLPDAWTLCQLNGLPAVVSRDSDGLLQASLLEIEARQIRRIYVLRNPDKTRHLAALLEGSRETGASPSCP